MGISYFVTEFQVQGCKRLTLQPDQTKFVLPGGESVQSECFCSRGSDEDTEVFWQFKSGNKVPKKNNRNRNVRPHQTELQSKNSATLVIPDLSMRWEGVYLCVAIRGQKVVESITVKIEQLPGKPSGCTTAPHLMANTAEPTPNSSTSMMSSTTTSYSSTVVTTTSFAGKCATITCTMLTLKGSLLCGGLIHA